MMSTADSALLTTSSIMNRDLFDRYLMRARTVKFQLLTGKVLSWIIILPLAGVATWAVKEGFTVWQILSIKLEVLMQTAPVIWIGVRSRRLRGSVAFGAMLFGCLFTLFFWLLYTNAKTQEYAFLFLPEGAVPKDWSAVKKVFGLQAGVVAFLINASVCLLACALWPAKKPDPAPDHTDE